MILDKYWQGDGRNQRRASACRDRMVREGHSAVWGSRVRTAQAQGKAEAKALQSDVGCHFQGMHVDSLWVRKSSEMRPELGSVEMVMGLLVLSNQFGFYPNCNRTREGVKFIPNFPITWMYAYPAIVGVESHLVKNFLPLPCVHSDDTLLFTVLETHF